MSFERLTFVGGGRWASIVLKELLRVSPCLKVDWVCHSSFEDKKKYLKSSEIFKNVSLIDKKNYRNCKNKKIIIASHSSQHCKDLFKYANVDSKILIEKPLFSSINDFESMHTRGLKNVFINLEFYFAYFVRDFYKEIEAIPFKKLEFIWHDPFYEKRATEKSKYSEIYSSIFLDQLLHVISIFKVFNLTPENFKNISVKKDNVPNSNSIKINFLSANTHISVSLSRFASIRKRKIILNDGELELYFSDKPLIYKNKVFEREISLSDGFFPVRETLKNFLNFPDSKEILEISTNSLLPFLRFCFKCEEKFVRSLSKDIDLLSLDKKDLKKFEPAFAYHAGIMYYQQLLRLNSSCDIHFIKGDKGLNRLKDWWLTFIESSVLNTRSNHDG